MFPTQIFQNESRQSSKLLSPLGRRPSKESRYCFSPFARQNKYKIQTISGSLRWQDKEVKETRIDRFIEDGIIFEEGSGMLTLTDDSSDENSRKESFSKPDQSKLDPTKSAGSKLSMTQPMKTRGLGLIDDRDICDLRLMSLRKEQRKKEKLIHDRTLPFGSTARRKTI